MTSASEVYQALRAAGFSADKAVIMTAIAKAESGLRLDAVGDKSLANGTWGPSVGLFQVRTLKAQTGTGGTRDIKALTGNVTAQARAAFEISNGGRNFGPWTTFTSGAYAKNLAGVTKELGAAGGGLTAPSPSGGATGGVGIGVASPLVPLGALGNLLGLGLGDVADNAAGGIVKGIAKVVIVGTALTTGVVLVVLGLYRGVAPVVEPMVEKAKKKAVTAASVAAVVA